MKDTIYNNKNQPEPQYKIHNHQRLLRYHFPVIDSTNTWAKTNVEKWENNGITLVTATEQTGGRGRFKRRWESPGGVNIYATFCFFIGNTRTDIGQIPQLLAFSAVQVLDTYHFSPTIKWPNDILISGKKMGGILCETTQYRDQLGVICGIGLDINMTKEMIEKIDQPTTSLLVESGKEHDVEQILEKLIETFVLNLQLFLKMGFAPFFLDFQQRSHFVCGQEICIQDGTKIWKGDYIRLNADGSISLKLSDGTIKTCVSGEIVQ